MASIRGRRLLIRAPTSSSTFKRSIRKDHHAGRSPRRYYVGELYHSITECPPTSARRRPRHKLKPDVNQEKTVNVRRHRCRKYFSEGNGILPCHSVEPSSLKPSSAVPGKRVPPLYYVFGLQCGIFFIPSLLIDPNGISCCSRMLLRPPQTNITPACCDARRLNRWR